MLPPTTTLFCIISSACVPVDDCPLFLVSIYGEYIPFEYQVRNQFTYMHSTRVIYSQVMLIPTGKTKCWIILKIAIPELNFEQVAPSVGQWVSLNCHFSLSEW